MTASNDQISNEYGGKEDYTVLMKKIRSTGFFSVFSAIFLFMFLRYGNEVLGQQGHHWSLDVILVAMVLLNIAAFTINVGILVRRKKNAKKDRTEAANRAEWANSRSGRESESYMDDPEVKAMMDRVRKH